MLTDVPEINQKDYQDLIRFTIRSGSNMLVLGPSGGGKTIMAKQVAQSEGANLVYINLAVLERPDFQGLPVLSRDNRSVSYATPRYLPFVDTTIQERIEDFSNALNYIEESDPVAKDINALLEQAKSHRKAQVFEDIKRHLPQDKNLVSAVDKIASKVAEAKDVKPIVFLFDEVDKATTDTNQVLLELLQFKSINGRPLNIKACILTGNLPDEHAHTAQISHAITKRCGTYKLNIEFKQWRNWAFEAGLNEKIVGFLISEEKYLNKKAPDGDPTAYAIPSPRTWEMAAHSLDILENDPLYKNLSHSELSLMQQSVVAGCVGANAAKHFSNWNKYFKKIDPYVKKLMDDGTHPPNDMSAQETIVCAIQACTKAYSEIEKCGKDQGKLFKITKNVYTWIKTLSYDMQIAGVRLGIGPNAKKCLQAGLVNVDEFKDVFRNVKDRLGQAGADISKKK